jgi:hypothetical protein
VHVLGRGLGWSGIAIAVALAFSSLAVWFAEGVILVWMAALIWICVASVALAIRSRRSPALPVRTERSARVSSPVT